MNQVTTPWLQCTSTLRTRSGYVFCTRTHGHKDDHRGTRAQWNNAHERRPITLDANVK